MEKTPLHQLIDILNGLAESITDEHSEDDKWYRSGLCEAIYQAKLLLIEEERVNNTDCVDGKKDTSRRPSGYEDLEKQNDITTKPLDTKTMTEKKEQTAVDYLLDTMYKIVELNPEELRELNEAAEKAKEMIKKQIITAFDLGLDDIDYRFDPNRAERYYYETFGYEDE